MIREAGDWTKYRQRFPGIKEIDFHWSGADDDLNYWQRMQVVHDTALDALKAAQADGTAYVMFRHGCSTSLGWQQTTSRSVIRGLMRSKDATPLIMRSRCIQHDTVFVAVIRPKGG